MSGLAMAVAGATETGIRKKGDIIVWRQIYYIKRSDKTPDANFERRMYKVKMWKGNTARYTTPEIHPLIIPVFMVITKMEKETTTEHNHQC